MPSFKRPIGASGVVLAMALVAAACGSGSTDTTASGSASAGDAEPAESSVAPAATDAPTGSASEPAAEAEGPSPVAPHSFPDLDTVTIGDGATVNLADELAGGDTPVLLWFFAPH